MSFIYNMSDTWNAAGTQFQAILMNISNGAGGTPVYAAGSRAINIQNNGTVVFAVSVNGEIGVGTNAAAVSGIKVTVLDSGTTNEILQQSTGNATSTFAYTRVVYGGTNHYVDYGIGSTDNIFIRAVTNIGAGTVALAISHNNGATPLLTIFGSGLVEVGSLKIDQTPTGVSGAAIAIGSAADGAANIGHRLSFNANGTTYWIPCSSVAF